MIFVSRKKYKRCKRQLDIIDRLKAGNNELRAENERLKAENLTQGFECVGVSAI
jgi:hypothetical protein